VSRTLPLVSTMSESRGIHQWPDLLDVTTVVVFLVVAILLPASGYFFMVADYRAYLRSLRRHLVRVVGWPGQLPEWAKRETPHCLTAFGLTLHATEDELKQAYRRRVKDLHPDRGGDRRRFLMLQGHFEESLKLVRQQQHH